MMKTVAFLGSGNMSGAMVRAMVTGCEPDRIVVTNRTPEKAARLAAETGCALAASNPEAAMSARYVVLGVKPQQLPAVLGEIAPYLTEGQTLVSLAAGVTIRAMAEILARFGKKLPIVRALPNTPCAIGQGLVVLAPSPDLPESSLLELERLLTPCGRVSVTTEAQADAVMTIGGCTPAFTYLFLEALADGAVAAGLPREQALTYAAQAVLGAAAMVLETGKHPGQLKDAVCSPGGSTIRGIRTLEDRAFRGAAAEAVLAAWKRTRELGS